MFFRKLVPSLKQVIYDVKRSQEDWKNGLTKVIESKSFSPQEATTLLQEMRNTSNRLRTEFNIKVAALRMDMHIRNCLVASGAKLKDLRTTTMSKLYSQAKRKK